MNCTLRTNVLETLKTIIWYLFILMIFTSFHCWSFRVSWVLITCLLSIVIPVIGMNIISRILSILICIIVIRCSGVVPNNLSGRVIFIFSRDGCYTIRTNIPDCMFFHGNWLFDPFRCKFLQFYDATDIELCSLPT